MTHRIEAVSTRPDLAPLVANWLVAEFGHPGGRTPDQVTARILGPNRGPEETFVLFDQDKPVGTASLSHDDLAARRDLTPWLAGVFVEPSARGLGYASALVRRVEAFAAANSVPTLWLYTWTAAPLYARLGWQHAGLETDRGQEDGTDDAAFVRGGVNVPCFLPVPHGSGRATDKMGKIS